MTETMRVASRTCFLRAAAIAATCLALRWSPQAQQAASPTLGVSVNQTSGAIRLSWPAFARNFVLEEATSVGGSLGWHAVAAAPTTDNNELNVSIVPKDTIRFYRLRQTASFSTFQIARHTPLKGATEVGVTVRPQIFFSNPVNPTTLSQANLFAQAAGVLLDASIVPANDGSFAWLFFKKAMPGGTRVRVTVDGSSIRSASDGVFLDGDGDGAPGGSLHFEFTTVSLVGLPGTSLSGMVVDPGPDLIPRTADDLDPGPDGVINTLDDGFFLPIAGVKVYLLGLEDQAVMTGGNGHFHFDSVPTGDVKVVIDGRTASTPPPGVYFPEMVMDAQMIPGIENYTMLGMPPVYLPRLSTNILQKIDGSQANVVTAKPEGGATLTPDQREHLTIEVAANSLIAPDGTRLSSGQIGISTVPAELVRDMLPPGVLQHTFDITVQAPGIATFSTPAPMTFPNVFNAAPGTQLKFLSFDHTTGRLVIEGTATVSADGSSVRTDPGTGITHPGWHGLTPPGGPNDPPCDPQALHDVDVDPEPLTEGVRDYLFKDDDGSFTLSFGNAGGKLVPKEDPCSPANIRALPLVFSIKTEGPVVEFLDGASIPDLVLLPGQQKSLKVKMRRLLTPDQVSKASQNVLYGATLKIEARKYNSAIPLLQKTMYVYRLFDIADTNHTDGIVDFEKTLRDGRGGVRQSRALLLKLPASARPDFSVDDDAATATLNERDDFFVEMTSPTVATLIFDPVSGTDPVPGNLGGYRSTTVQVLAPSKNKAGQILVRGLGLSPQIILFPKSGFQGAVGTLIDQSPLPAAWRGFAQQFPVDGPDVGVLRSDEAGFAPAVDTLYQKIAANMGQIFADLGSAAGAGTSPLVVMDSSTLPGQLVFSSFFKTSLPGSTTLCGATALACSTWADFLSTSFGLVTGSGSSVLQQRFAFDSLINRSYGDPNNAIRSGGSQSITLYLDVAAEGANSDPTVFIPYLSNAIVHEIGHNLGAIHLRNNAKNYIWGDHDVMGLGERDRHKLSKFRTFAPLIKFALGLPVSDTEFKAIVAYYKKYLSKETYAFDTLIAPADSLSDTEVLTPVLSVYAAPLVIDGTELDEIERLDFGATLNDGPGKQLTSRKLYLFNNSGTNLIVSAVRIVGNPAFHLQSANAFPVDLPPIDPNVIQPDLSTSVLSIQFDPELNGEANAVLEIDSNDLDQPTAQIALHGVGLSPIGSIALNVLGNNLGGIRVGSSSTLSHFAEVSNLGSQDLKVRALRPVSGQGEFSIIGLTAGSVIAPGQTVGLDVFLSPATIGLRRGQWDILSDDPEHLVLHLDVVGTGLAPSGNSLDSLDYGNDYVAMESPDFPNGLVLRAKTDAQGNFSFFLPPDQRYHAVIFDPISGLVAHLSGLTAPSGKNTQLGTPVFGASTAPDTDGDGLPDDIEFAIGTDPHKVDTDGNGLDDFTAIAQGLDPFGGRAVVTGVIAQLPLGDDARDVQVLPNGRADGQLAYLAAQDAGLVIADVTRPASPTILGRLNLADVAHAVSVDPIWQTAAVAGGSMHLIDVSDPGAPALLGSYPFSARQVAAFDGYAYFQAAGKLRALGFRSGTVEQAIDLAPNGLNSLTREGHFLYGLDFNATLTVIEVDGKQMHVRGSVQFPGANPSVAGFLVADGIAYLPVSSYSANGSSQVGGYLTVDVSDPDKPVLISGSTVPAGTSAPGTALALNGSGLGILIGTPPGAAVNAADLLNVSNSKNTYTFLTRFSLPAPPQNVVIAGGTAFIADGSAGLVVLNYQPFDTTGQSPTVAIAGVFAEADPVHPSTQLFEGSRFHVRASLADDAQVRMVELLVNGQVVATGSSAPFDLDSFAPSLALKPDFEVQVRATDTGGNVGVSPLTTIGLLRDSTPPVLLQIEPAEGEEKFLGFDSVHLILSERLADGSLTASNFEVADQSGKVLRPIAFNRRDLDRDVELKFKPLDEGHYRLTIHAATVTDRAGNPLGSSDVIRPFVVLPYSILWSNPLGGDWFQPANWLPHRVPTNTDVVVITLTNAHSAPVFIGTDRNTTTEPIETYTKRIHVRRIESNARLHLFYVDLHADEFVRVNNFIDFAGSRLTNTRLISDSNTVLRVEGLWSRGLEGNSILDNVTLEGDATIYWTSTVGSGFDGFFSVINGLTLNGSLFGGSPSASLQFDLDSSTIRGTGTFRDVNLYLGTDDTEANKQFGFPQNLTLTISSNITVRGGFQLISQGTTKLLNQGKIIAEKPHALDASRGGSGIEISSMGMLLNEGSIEVGNGDRMSLAIGPVINRGVIRVGAQSALFIGSPLVSPKTICEAGGVCELDGIPLTTELGNISELAGTGAWMANQVHFVGGTVKMTEGAVLEGDASFNNVTFEGELHNYDWNSRKQDFPAYLSGYGITMSVITNFTLNGRIVFERKASDGNPGVLLVAAGSPRLGGHGEIEFPPAGPLQLKNFIGQLRAGVPAGSVRLTIGPDLTIHCRNLEVGVDNLTSDTSPPVIENQGTLLVNELGGALSISSLGFTNSGIIQLGLSNTIVLNGRFAETVFTQTSSGKLQFDAAGTTPGTTHGQVQVLGKSALNGLLTVSVVPPFQPTTGDVLNLLTSGSLTGAFSAIQAPAGTPPAQWNPVYGKTNFALHFGPPAPRP